MASVETLLSGSAAASDAEVTVIMVSYNTRELTLKALETLFANAGRVAMHVVVLDNASADGSADAIEAHFPQVELIRSEVNTGFAKANNIVAEQAKTEWLLLLNPDTETYPNAVENLLAFAKAHPDAGIVGGRTVFPDGSLNAASCWNRITLWSLFCSTFGLTRLFHDSPLFNSEGIGGWKRDSARHVDIVVGCFFMLRTQLWRELGGFDLRYVMYAEESDMCLRAAKLGYRPMITPDAQIMHLVGASSKQAEQKLIKVLRGRATLIRDHWPASRARLGIALMWMWGGTRRAASIAARLLTGNVEAEQRWRTVWAARKLWLAGY